MISRYCCIRYSSSRLLAIAGPSTSQPLRPQNRHLASISSAIAPFFQYASQCNITLGVQSIMEASHTMGLPWWAAIVGTGVALRLATAPLHILSEKLHAERLFTSNRLTQTAVQHISKVHNVKIGPNSTHGALELKTNDENVKKIVNNAVENVVMSALSDKKLLSSRIQNLKMCSVPVWIFSSFALRNIISSDFHPSIPGGLWLTDLLVPDPYFVLPVAVGLFGFFNLWSQRKIYSLAGAPSTRAARVSDGILVFFTCFAIHIMTQLPACIPLYWLTVSVTGIAQAQLLRMPRIKKLLNIRQLPIDSPTPLRDLFLMRRT